MSKRCSVEKLALCEKIVAREAKEQRKIEKDIIGKLK